MLLAGHAKSLNALMSLEERSGMHGFFIACFTVTVNGSLEVRLGVGC